MRVWILLGIFFVGLPARAAAISSEERVHEALPFHGQHLPDEFGIGRNGPQFGLYVDKGSWETGKEHLKMYLTERGLSYRSFTAKQIIDGELTSSRVRTLIMPGGESWTYLKDLGEAGAQAIRSFVSSGHGYIGICAGAFYATSRREGGVATGPYGIGLLDGVAYDGTALKTPPFIEGMMDFDVRPHSLMEGFPLTFRIVLFGGPSFRYTPEEAAKKRLGVLMEVQQVKEPTMIVFHYGKGPVFLSGPHLEIEEDRTDWGPDYFDPETDWVILDRVRDRFLQ